MRTADDFDLLGFIVRWFEENYTLGWLWCVQSLNQTLKSSDRPLPFWRHTNRSGTNRNGHSKIEFSKLNSINLNESTFWTLSNEPKKFEFQMSGHLGQLFTSIPLATNRWPWQERQSWPHRRDASRPVGETQTLNQVTNSRKIKKENESLLDYYPFARPPAHWARASKLWVRANELQS